MRQTDAVLILAAVLVLGSLAALQAPGPWSWPFFWRDSTVWYLKAWVVLRAYVPAAAIGFGSMLMYQLSGRMVMYGSRASRVFAVSAAGIALVMIGLRFIAMSPGVLPAYACGFGAANAFAARIYAVTLSDRKFFGVRMLRFIWRDR